MTDCFRRFALLLVAACFLATGCSKDSSTDSGGGGDAAANEPADAAAVPEVGAPGGGGGKAVPTTPDGAVKEFIAAIKENKLDRIWNLLPGRYQNDINSIVRDFGKGVDAELWDGFFKTANRYLSVTLAKQDMILQTPEAQEQLRAMAAPMAMMGNPLDLSHPEKLKDLSQPGYEAAIALLGSQLKTAKELQSFDGGKFLGGPMSVFLSKIRQLVDTVVKALKDSPQFAQNPMMQAQMGMMDIDKLLSGVKVTVQSTQGDSATVAIVAMGRPLPPLPMTKVDGKWVPADMAAGWDEQIKMIKGGVGLATVAVNSLKEKVMPELAKVEPLLGELQEAKTQEEVNTAYAKLQSAFMSPIAQATGMQGLSPGGAGGIAPVTVIVSGKLNGRETRDLIQALEAVSDDPKGAITMVESDFSQTTFRVSPVGSFEDYCAKLTFGEVTDTDPLKRELHLKVTGNLAGAGTVE